MIALLTVHRQAAPAVRHQTLPRADGSHGSDGPPARTGGPSVWPASGRLRGGGRGCVGAARAVVGVAGGEARGAYREVRVTVGVAHPLRHRSGGALEPHGARARARWSAVAVRMTVPVA